MESDVLKSVVKQEDIGVNHSSIKEKAKFKLNIISLAEVPSAKEKTRDQHLVENKCYVYYEGDEKFRQRFFQSGADFDFTLVG